MNINVPILHGFVNGTYAHLCISKIMNEAPWSPLFKFEKVIDNLSYILKMVFFKFVINNGNRNGPHLHTWAIIV